MKKINLRKTLLVAENQRVLMFKNQVLSDVLMPGKHQFWDLKKELSFVSFDINQLYATTPNIERLYQQTDLLTSHILHYKLQADQVGLLYLNDILQGIVAPSENLYLWKEAGDIRLDRLNIDEQIDVDEKLMHVINRAGVNHASRLIKSKDAVAMTPIADLTVPKENIGLLYVDGKLVKQLASGKHAFWQFNHKIELVNFDCRTQMLDISGQEILSKDRVSLRVNLAASIQVNNAELAAKSVDNLNDYVYKILQLALREAVGTKTLDELLEDKLYINETVKSLVLDEVSSIGVTLVSVGVKDIILPGEMKAILNQVVEAQKAAEANVIRRREETSATRSLYNTAKVMENNPTLLRLKELEALEKIADRINNLTVYGGLEGLTNGLIKIG